MDSPKDDEEDLLYKSNGCIITAADEPAVVASVVCCVCYLVLGACAAALGAALPSLAEHFHKSKSELGIAFTTRGIGFLIGTLCSAAVLRCNRMPPKELVTAIALSITGITCGVISASNSLLVVMACFFLQGLAFGTMETVANCLLPEVWGRRVQPWMQAMHSCFGIGAIIGPTLVGALDYPLAFNTIMIASAVPLLALLAYRAIQRTPVHVLIACDELPVTTKSAPFFLKALVCYFFFTYVGTETGFAGWVPTYALDMHVTDSKAQAAYLSSIFWATMTTGRIVAVPVAIFVSATVMIRCQLVMIVCCCFVSLFALPASYLSACICCGAMGLSLSCVFPVMLTLFADYGYAM